MKINDQFLDYIADRYQAMRRAAQLPLRMADGRAFTFERFLAQVAACRKGGV